MKANLISSGLVNLLLCLHCGAFSRFASVGIASAPKGFLACLVMGTQHVGISERVAWWENVTALACLYRIPLAVLVFFFLPSLCFVQLFPPLSLVSQQVFSPIQPVFFGFPLFRLIFVLCLRCCLCVFLFVSVLFLTLLFRSKRLSICGSFVCEICVSFFTMTLLCFLILGVQMPNEIISVCTASVPVILFIAIHYWKQKCSPDWVPWWFQAAIKGCHLQCRVDQ